MADQRYKILALSKKDAYYNAKRCFIGKTIEKRAHNNLRRVASNWYCGTAEPVDLAHPYDKEGVVFFRVQLKKLN